MMHRVLERQLKKIFPAEIPVFSPEIQKLCDLVSETYKDADESRALIERSLDISSKELGAINSSLNTEKSELQKTNEFLAKTKTAMINLLEDLAEEKKSVDLKVVERTHELALSLEELRESKDKIETLVESMGDGVMAIDATGAILIWNKTAVSITGWSKEEVKGKYFKDILKIVRESDHADGSSFIDAALKEGTVKTMENHMLLVRKDGIEIPVGDSASAIKDSEGKVSGVIVVFRDVSKERALDKAKDEFVSIASHQLRTPLTAIRGYSGMLLDQDPGPINDKQREYLTEISHGNNRMIELITALLNVSRIDLGVFSIEPEDVNLEEAALGILKELEINIKEKKLRLETEIEKELPPMNADRKIVQMIFQNLLSNAVKYTPPEGTVSLVVKKDDANFLISVKDTGYGIPEKVQAKIFTKMFRADNAREKDPDGTGLGLYIIRSAIEGAGGKIWFESKENGGTTFYVSIPLQGMKKKQGEKSLQ